MFEHKKNDSNFENLVRIRRNKRSSSPENVASTDDVVAKVMEDITFLRDWISKIKRTNKSASNPSILKTYQSMLESREAALASMSDTSDDYFSEKTQFN